MITIRKLCKISVPLCLAIIIVSNFGYASDEKRELEDTLAGVKLGTKVEELIAKYPGIYKHQLIMGELLYEACNQKQLEVLTFTEEPWSKGYITNIWIRKEEESVCRDSTGSLPDYSIPPITSRGVALGDIEEKVSSLYGQPTEIKTMKNGNKMMSFRKHSKREGDIVRNLSLHFEIENGRVKGFHLFGDMPWAKKPF
ncbi:MAG: hypothetical protein MUO63_01965 [Desulfobulbaceae bacterium]|nr:hypothetical protein [Desulfobulbaceae bacterium]